jgi:hypothetical protein
MCHVVENTLIFTIITFIFWDFSFTRLEMVKPVGCLVQTEFFNAEVLEMLFNDHATSFNRI